MKYGDFLSIVQLGVGLHVGTAVLQIYGELGVARLVRVIRRTRGLFSADVHGPEGLEAELERLEGDYEIFSIQLFQEFRKYVVINSLVALALAVVLVIITLKSDDALGPGSVWAVIAIIALSFFPAPITLAALWIDAGRKVKPMLERADDLEERALSQVGRRE